MEDTRYCPICQQRKPFNEFYFERKTGKPISGCKKCRRILGKNRKGKKRKYSKESIENKRIYDIEYRKSKKEIIAGHKKNWEKRMRDDPLYKIRKNTRRRLHHVLKGYLKADNTFNLVGCTAEELKAYLESKFKPGMSWDNYGLGDDKWHIDHIRPCSSYNLLEELEQRACFHYTNLQPLWQKENLSKSKKYTTYSPQSPSLPSHPNLEKYSSEPPHSPTPSES